MLLPYWICTIFICGHFTEHLTAMVAFSETKRPTVLIPYYSTSYDFIATLIILFIYCHIVSFSCHRDYITHWYTILLGPIQLQL